VCGINGRFNFDGRPVRADEIAAMRDILLHRGPDDAGLFVQGSVGLGHRRLAIIDLSGGHQPLANEDGSITVVFNGEIYNFQELRDELLARGHCFRTRSDTEVIVHLYEDVGAECVRRFRGMFAFALWDSTKQCLLLARDRLGVKPLYFAERSDTLLFASEIKAILHVMGGSPEPDPIGLRRYLAYRHSYGQGTLFKGIRQLPPGHVLIADARKVQVRRYWDVPDRDDSRAQGRNPREFLPLLEEAVELRMISDVPIGAFLSGGIDSSVITALMARHTDRVRTFSVGFVPSQESELHWAQRVATHTRAQHHEFTQSGADFFSLLQRLIWHHDEPLTFPASIPLYLLSRESKPVATVMLAGEGADELLAGYDTNIRTYWLARAARLLPLGLRHRLARLPLPARIAAIAGRVARDEADLIVGTFRLAGHEDLVRACRIPLPAPDADDRELYEDTGTNFRAGSFLDRLLYFQLKTYLVALLMKQDKMSMAASIETRVPYLDHKLVELAFALPDACKVHGRKGKYLLKSVSRELLPRAVIDRPKRGFPVPIAHWMLAPGNPLLDILLDPESLRSGLLDPAYVRGRVDQFLKGANISLEIWALLNLELWRRQFLAGERIPQRTGATI